MKSDQLRKKYSQLTCLFTAYFTSAWGQQYHVKEKVVLDFTSHSEIDELLDTLLEIDEIKRQFPDDEKLKDVIEEALGLGNGLGIYLIGMTAVQWLDFVSSIIKEELSKRQK